MMLIGWSCESGPHLELLVLVFMMMTGVEEVFMFNDGDKW
jgi:hypothetical protein